MRRSAAGGGESDYAFEAAALSPQAEAPRGRPAATAGQMRRSLMAIVPESGTEEMR